jgi:hypothetical protein
VTGLDCDGADRGNWAILDVTSMRWLRFAGRPISNVLCGLVGPLGRVDRPRLFRGAEHLGRHRAARRHRR